MTTNERDTHFQGFAHLLFPEVSKLFFTLYARIEEHRSIEEIDSVEDEIKTLLARRAYDLVHYTLLQAVANRPTGLYTDFIREHVPDLTAWFNVPES